MKRKYIDTAWIVANYDVWGNAKDGYQVNNVYRHGTVDLRIPVYIYNQGTEREFKEAFPTDKQIREALNVKPRVRLDLDGDDLNIYANHESTHYPLGELRCISHESLSPIRANKNKED